MKRSRSSGLIRHGLWLAAFGLGAMAFGVSPAQQAAAVGQGTAAVAAVAPAGVDRHLTDKQKVLSAQADQLLAMATELKLEVDMTSKNILSVKVVRKAEEIELYAHHMKDQAKK